MLTLLDKFPFEGDDSASRLTLLPSGKRSVAHGNIFDELADGKSHFNNVLPGGDFHVDDPVGVDFDSDRLVAERNSTLHWHTPPFHRALVSERVNPEFRKPTISSGIETHPALAPLLAWVGAADTLPPRRVSAAPSLLGSQS
jgi:hypothetical protein